MKLRYKIIIPVLIVLTITILIICLSVLGNNQTKFYVVKKHYSIVSDTNPTMDIRIFTNSEENEYLTKEKIIQSSIYNDQDYYSTEIVSIKKLDGVELIKETECFQYKIELKLNFEIEKMLNIQDAKLELVYLSNEKMIINVGNICFEKYSNDNIINIKKVQAICNDLGNLESLVGLKISIENDLSSSVRIKSLKVLSQSIEVNNQFVIVDEYNTEIEHTTPLSQIVGKQYNLYQKSTTPFNPIDLDQNTAKDIIIPLTYTQKEFVDHLGLLIEIDYNDSTYYQIITPYLLFTTSNLDYAIYEYEIINNTTK